MKKGIAALIVYLFLIAGYSGHAQTVSPPYQVGTWSGFRSAAISYTFDDGSPNQFTKVVPMFNDFGFPMTLFTVTGPAWGWPVNWTTLQNAASHGHEIASHTVTHGYLNTMSDSLQTIELENSRQAIDTHITGQKCITIAYPYCQAGNTTLCGKYYIAARNCSGIIEPSTPADDMNISSIICGTEGSVKTVKNFNDRANSAAGSKGWCIYLIHGIDNDGGWSSLPADTLRGSLAYLSVNPDKFWVSSFGNVARYYKERNTVSVTELSNQDTTITVQVTDTLPDSIFDFPVTLRRPLPQDWPSAEVTQNGRQRETKIVTVQNVPYIQFEAVPDGGDVQISKSDISDLPDRSGIMVPAPNLWQNYPNPFNSYTTIKFELLKAEPVIVKIYDVSGREVITLVNDQLQAGRHSVRFAADGISSGVYFYNLRGPGFFLQHKMLLLR
jgi:hypothetical protein